MTVLEVGSGGYNAALLAELADRGRVISMDIDPEIAGRAREALTQQDMGRVRVVLGDAENGVPGLAPFDRIIVTAGAWDIPPAWRASWPRGQAGGAAAHERHYPHDRVPPRRRSPGEHRRRGRRFVPMRATASIAGGVPGTRRQTAASGSGSFADTAGLESLDGVMAAERT